MSSLGLFQHLQRMQLPLRPAAFPLLFLLALCRRGASKKIRQLRLFPLSGLHPGDVCSFNHLRGVFFEVEFLCHTGAGMVEALGDDIYRIPCFQEEMSERMPQSVWMELLAAEPCTLTSVFEDISYRSRTDVAAGVPWE